MAELEEARMDRAVSEFMGEIFAESALEMAGRLRAAEREAARLRNLLAWTEGRLARAAARNTEVSDR
jgi:hypothetical protein